MLYAFYDDFPFVVIVSHIAFKELTIPLNNDSSLSSLKEIQLLSRQNELSEVQINAPKSRIFFREDALVVNISKETSYQAQNLTNVLRRMPGVDIGKEGSVTVNGKTAMVYIDGVPQKALNPEILKKILNAYPSNIVEEVEINACSSGAYGSAPQSAYINVVTKS